MLSLNMKHSLRNILLLSLLFLALMASGQNNTATQHKTHYVIMQVTQGDSLSQVSVIGQIRNIKKILPGARIEVVCHANALDMLVQTKTKVSDHISELSKQDVTFAACENTMERKQITKDKLSSHVVTVPSALVEIILKQEEGWSYIKGGY
jgi:uncharacterized protein